MIGEDAICCALGERLVESALPGWRLARESINTGGVTKLAKSIGRYRDYASHVHPVLCIADTDGQCAVELLARWLPTGAGAGLLLRFAVPEAESWVLADRDAAASFFGLRLAQLTFTPDTIMDPKLEMLRLARKSRIKAHRQEMVAANLPERQGAGYNVHLCRLIREQWSPTRAAEHSPSLRRACSRLRELEGHRP